APANKPASTSAQAARGPDDVIVRGQSPGAPYDQGPGGYSRGPQPVSGGAPLPPYPLNSSGGNGNPPPQPYAPAPQPYSSGQNAPQYGPPFVQSQPNYAYQPQIGPGASSGLPGPPPEAMPGVSGGMSSIAPPGYQGFQTP